MPVRGAPLHPSAPGEPADGVGARLRVPTSLACSKPKYNHPETAFPCRSLFSSFPLLLVLISRGFVCNQTPPAAAREASLVAAGPMGPALRSAVGRGGFALQMRILQELAALVEEVKRLTAGLGNFPEQGEACQTVIALELFFFVVCCWSNLDLCLQLARSHLFCRLLNAFWDGTSYSAAKTLYFCHGEYLFLSTVE